MTTADRLRESLRERGWSGAELARRLGISQPTVHAWLHGQHGLRWTNARLVARALGISPAWLMFGTERRDETIARTGEELALLRLFRELDDLAQAALLRRLRRRTPPRA